LIAAVLGRVVPSHHTGGHQMYAMSYADKARVGKALLWLPRCHVHLERNVLCTGKAP